MSADATTAHPEPSVSFRRRRPWGTAVPLILMVAAFLAGLGLYYGSSGSSAKRILLPKTPLAPKTVTLGRQETSDLHALIRQFVHTAVARKNLAESYRIIGPALREGIPLKRWIGGQVTVVPYPVDAKTTILFEKPDQSYARRVQFQVHVITPDRPNETAHGGTETFFVGLIKMKVHGQWRWLVNDWVPRMGISLPNSAG